jgi:hypothetical protein
MSYKKKDKKNSGNTHMTDQFFWFGARTSIKSGGMKQA